MHTFSIFKAITSFLFLAPLILAAPNPILPISHRQETNATRNDLTPSTPIHIEARSPHKPQHHQQQNKPTPVPNGGYLGIASLTPPKSSVQDCRGVDIFEDGTHDYYGRPTDYYFAPLICHDVVPEQGKGNCFGENRRHEGDDCEAENWGALACGPGKDGNVLVCLPTSNLGMFTWEIDTSCTPAGPNACENCQCVAGVRKE